jgi:quinol monooxygenase YgiN
VKARTGRAVTEEATMSGPFCYVGTWKLRDEHFEEARRWLAAHCEDVEANEPRMIAFHMFVNEQERTASVVQVHPDAESMQFHMKVISEHLGNAFDYIDHIIGQQYFGTPTPALAETLARWDSPEVVTTWKPVHDGGFTRTTVR